MTIFFLNLIDYVFHSLVTIGKRQNTKVEAVTIAMAVTLIKFTLSKTVF